MRYYIVLRERSYHGPAGCLSHQARLRKDVDDRLSAGTSEESNREEYNKTWHHVNLLWYAETIPYSTLIASEYHGTSFW